MSKIDLIIDALLVAPPSVWSARLDEALFAARELKADATQPLANSQLYKQIVERLAEIDDDIARLRQQHLMLRVDIQILLEKKCLKNL